MRSVPLSQLIMYTGFHDPQIRILVVPQFAVANKMAAIWRPAVEVTFDLQCAEFGTRIGTGRLGTCRYEQES
jgi:hypothetical protein